MQKITFKIIPADHHDYEQILNLRHDVLRKPINLAFTPEDLAWELPHIHIAGYDNDTVCATCMLVNKEPNTLRIQRSQWMLLIRIKVLDNR